MSNAQMAARTERIGDCDELIRIETSADGTTLYMGDRIVRRMRLQQTTVCILAVMLGIASTHWTPLGWVIAAVSAGLLMLVHMRGHAEPLLLIDSGGGAIVLQQSALGKGAVVGTGTIKAVRGIYGTRGWDPCVFVNADIGCGDDITLMVLSGGDDRMPRQACTVIGALLNKPATYVGEFGKVVECFTP